MAFSLATVRCRDNSASMLSDCFWPRVVFAQSDPKQPRAPRKADRRTSVN